MALRGKFETEQLKKNIHNQLSRLLMQLEDLERFKSEFDSVEEWLEEKRETEAQLKEFNEFLKRTLSGDMTLVDELSSIQIAIQATVADAFKTPEIIRLFAAKEPSHLREKLAQLKRDATTKKIAQKTYKSQAYEVLLALQKLGSKLTAEESSLMKSFEARGMKRASISGAIESSSILASAKTDVAKAGDSSSTSDLRSVVS